ncbi:hypothetical protein [uncultured Litoreibacter sp.]|uniref:hypothetical protein n=1 Tax=uncultured Litoreibacter sp. TaxID=1392394 RepID=UPI00262BAB92|nr:hypothetical protein [uncultured Litoreibacter sp.]
MALADYGFDATFEASENESPIVLSLDESTTRTGYAVRASQAAAGLKARYSRIILSAAMSGTGLFLMIAGGSIVADGAKGAWLLTPIAIYLFLAGLVWLSALLRRPQELNVDHKGRCFHLIKRGLRGAEVGRQTIRFEEVVKISLIDHLASLDMRASAMNWDMGRIDVTWRQNTVTPMITGDVAELEPLLRRLRREVGMA